MLAWPIREGLTALLARMKVEARDAYQFEMQLWAAGVKFGAAGRPPALPDILKQR